MMYQAQAVSDLIWRAEPIWPAHLGKTKYVRNQGRASRSFGMTQGFYPSLKTGKGCQAGEEGVDSAQLQKEPSDARQMALRCRMQNF